MWTFGKKLFATRKTHGFEPAQKIIQTTEAVREIELSTGSRRPRSSR